MPNSPFTTPATLSPDLAGILGARVQNDQARALVGLDGFVDTILHAVGARTGPDQFTRIAKIRDFAERIAAASGRSANLELVTQTVRLGGNGPLLANGLARLGAPIDYIGTVGWPDPHPAFRDFAARARLHSLGEPAFTDAVEFEDGKLMLGEHDPLRGISWPRSPPGWAAQSGSPFFDLADPAKGSQAALQGALELIGAYQARFEVVLGMNFAEAAKIAPALGLAAPGEGAASGLACAAALRASLGIGAVTIHERRWAVAVSAREAAWAPSRFVPQPVTTTGAGDHYKAGFCLGLLGQAGLDACVAAGLATAGLYIRTGLSPTLPEPQAFVAEAVPAP